MPEQRPNDPDPGGWLGCLFAILFAVTALAIWAVYRWIA